MGRLTGRIIDKATGSDGRVTRLELSTIDGNRPMGGAGAIARKWVEGPHLDGVGHSNQPAKSVAFLQRA